MNMASENHDDKSDAELTGGDEVIDRALLETRPREDLINLILQLGVKLARMVERATLVKAYLLAALGSALGLGFHVYATWRGPSYMDTGRILNAVGSGLMFGPLIGLGIFLTRLIVHRLRTVRLLPKLVLGVLAGTIAVYLGIATFHTLFLWASPRGWPVVMGSALIALGFALSAGLVRRRALRALISAAGVGLGVGLSYYLCLISGYSSSPFLYHEPGRPLQTISLIIVTSLLMGSVAHVADL